MSTSEPYEVTVAPDGSIIVPPDEAARLGLRPGEHLRLVREESHAASPRRRSVRGIGVGQVDPADVLTWEDFEAAHEANVRVAEHKHGP